MSKKKKSQAHKSKGRHNENRTIRWREKLVIERIDRSGNPVPSEPKALAKAMIESGASKPPEYYYQPPEPSIPDNVLDFNQAKTQKDNRPKNQTGNEAKPFVTAGASEQSLVAKHNSAVIRTHIEQEKYLYKCWHDRVEKEKIPFAHMGRMYHEKLLKDQRERSEAGHKRLKFKAPPSTVHNPMLSDTPKHGGYVDGKSKPVSWHNQKTRGSLDPKFYMPPKPGSTAAPSGLPISAFLSGGKYAPPETSVEYSTTETTHEPTKDWGHKQSVYAEHVRRGTVDKHYRHEAANDADGRAYLVKRLISYVQWFINHVEPQNWSNTVHSLATWKDGDVFPNHGAINKAAARMEDELNIHKAMNDSHEREWKMLDGALADAHSENNLLRQELQSTQVELRQLEFLYSHSVGNHVDAKIIAEELLGLYVNVSKSKSPPEDADKLLTDFNLFKSFAIVDGLEHAYARAVYGDPSLGQVIRDHADMRCKERQDAVELRNVSRFCTKLSDTILGEMQAEYERQKHDEYASFWQEKYPVYLKQRARRSHTAVRDPVRESVALHAMARKSKPMLHGERRTFYSSLSRLQCRNSAVAKAITSKIKPTKCRYNNPNLVEHDTRDSWSQPAHRRHADECWWTERLEFLELRDAVARQPVKTAIVKTYNKTVDVLNTEMNPIARRQRKKLVEEARRRNAEYERECNERKELRKEEKAKAKQAKAERDHIRKMQRIAY